MDGECNEVLLCRRIVGNRLTKDALCLKLLETRLKIPLINIVIEVYIPLFAGISLAAQSLLSTIYFQILRINVYLLILEV